MVKVSCRRAITSPAFSEFSIAFILGRTDQISDYDRRKK